MIAVRELRFAYGAKPVLEGVSFALGAGGLTMLMGRNGAGKTTLMRCLLGLERRYAGDISLGGRDARALGARELARRVAYIPQRHQPAFSFEALDMVLMGATLQLRPFASPGARQRALALACMERMGVAHLARRGFARLSGGEQQLVLIARALCQQAPVLLMDEPTASLDYGNRLRLLAEARKLAREGYTVLMSTHSPQQALSYADRALALAHGRLIADGSPRDIIDTALMQALYGVRVAFADTPNGRVVLPPYPQDEGEDDQ